MSESASESRLQAVLATAIDGVITIDRRGTILDANESAERIFGWLRDELIGRNVRELMGEPDRSRHDGYLAHYLATGEARIIGTGREVTGQRRDGTPVPIRLAIGHARHAGEDLFVGFVTDISERRAMETALRASEQRLRAVMSNTPGVAYSRIGGPDGPLDFVSDAIERVSGYPAEDFVGLAPRRRYACLIHPEDRPAVAAEVAQAMAEGRPYLAEYRLIRRDGALRWIWENGRAVTGADGTAVALHGLLVDITDRHQSEQAVRRYQAIIASSDDAIISVTLDGAITSWNVGAERMFGWAAAEVVGKSMRLLMTDMLYDEETALIERIRLGESALHIETVHFRKGERELQVAVTLSPIRDDEGRVVGVSKFARDITERRAMEQDLREAKERAEQAAAARAAFLANMSHEIRTPMNSILGFTEVVLAGRLEDGQRRQLEMVRSAAGALMRLLNEILDTAKLDKGAVELELAPVDLVQAMDEIASPMGANAAAKGLGFAILMAPDLPRWVLADALRLRQVVTNLLDNAVKFTSRGSISLTLSPDSEGVRFEVRDTGIGIEPDRLAAIFDPFTQADASMTRRFGGTGLGTTISKQLVELMGGRIWVASVPGRGSTFGFVLPLPAVAAPAREERADLDAVGAFPRPLRILAVDDVVQNLGLIAAMLEPDGHRLTLAQDGAGALEAVRDAAPSGGFDVILLDVHMPRMDGLEATRRLARLAREVGRTPTPLIALTASVQDADREAARLAGMDGFVSKPLDRAQLLSEIHRVVGRIGDLPVPRRAAFDREAAAARWAYRVAPLRDALARFIAEHRGLAATLAALRDETDTARDLVHRVHGVAANLSLDALAGVLGDLECGFARGDMAAVDDGLSRLSGTLDEAFRAVEAHLDRAVAPDLPGPQPGDSLHLAASSASALDAALARGALDGAALDGLTAALGGTPLAPAVAELARAINDFDFPAALLLLDGVRRSLPVRSPPPGHEPSQGVSA